MNPNYIELEIYITGVKLKPSIKKTLSHKSKNMENTKYCRIKKQ